jgi:hypothetical protein
LAVAVAALARSQNAYPEKGTVVSNAANAALANLWNGWVSKLAEHWANSDSLLFFQQLGVREVPARG